MKTFDLYGFSSLDIDRIRRCVEEALGVEFEVHESSFGGVYLRHGSPGEEHLVLRHNFDALENEWAEDDFKDSQTLLYVNATARADEIRQLLLLRVHDAKPLRRDEAGG